MFLLTETCQPRIWFLCLKIHPEKDSGLHWALEYPVWLQPPSLVDTPQQCLHQLQLFPFCTDHNILLAGPPGEVFLHWPGWKWLERQPTVDFANSNDWGCTFRSQSSVLTTGSCNCYTASLSLCRVFKVIYAGKRIAGLSVRLNGCQLDS